MIYDVPFRDIFILTTSNRHSTFINLHRTMNNHQTNMEKLSDLKSFKRLNSLIRPKSAGGALNLTRELHELVAEDIYCLEQERDYDTILELYKFIVARLDNLKSETSGGVKGFISASLDYWQKMLDEKKPGPVVMKGKEDLFQEQSPDKGLSENRRVIIRPRIGRRSDSRLKRRSEKRPLGVGEIIGLAHETDYGKSRPKRTEQGSKIVPPVMELPHEYKRIKTYGRINVTEQGSRIGPRVVTVEVPPNASKPEQSIRQSLVKSFPVR